MIYLEDGTIKPVEKSELPIELPKDGDFNYLETLWHHIRLGKNTQKKTGKPAIRETTLDTL